MKWVTFAVVFLLTSPVVASIALYPEFLGEAAIDNNDFAFAFF